MEIDPALQALLVLLALKAVNPVAADRVAHLVTHPVDRGRRLRVGLELKDGGRFNVAFAAEGAEEALRSLGEWIAPQPLIPLEGERR